MCSPEPNDPQDAEVANMFLSDYERFASTARYKYSNIFVRIHLSSIILRFWTESYARSTDAAASGASEVSTYVIFDCSVKYWFEAICSYAILCSVGSPSC